MKTNRIHLTICFIFCTLSTNIYSQGDSVVKKELYNYLLKREFRQIISPETKNGVGNYTAFDPLATKVDLSGNIMIRDFQFMGIPVKADGNILAIKASGANSDGVLGLLNSKKWNNNIGLDFQYNILNPQKINFLDSTKNYIIVKSDGYRAYLGSLDRGDKFKTEISQKYKTRLDSMSLNIAKQRAFIVASKNKLLLVENKIQANEYLLKNKLQIAENFESRKRFIIDSLEYHHAHDTVKKRVNSMLDSQQNTLNKGVLDLKQSILDDKVNLINDSISLVNAVDKLNTMKNDSAKVFTQTLNEFKYPFNVARNKKSADLLDDIDVTGFRIRWFSFGYGVSNNSFKLMDPLLSINQTFTKTSFLTQEARVQFNSYRSGRIANENKYFSLWMKGTITDNFSSLSKIEIEETSEDTSGNRTRSTNQKYFVYSGNYVKNLKQLTFGIDYYKFLNQGIMALHVFPKWIITENLEPQLNIGLGLLVPIKNKQKTTEIINAEFFMDASNLFLTNNEIERDLFKRSSYGIRFTAPLNFKKEQ